MNLAINGFGRIGRQALKIALEKDEITVVAINDLAPVDILAQLLKYDSVYGIYNKTVSVVIDDEVITNIPDLTKRRLDGEDFSKKSVFLKIDNFKIKVFAVPVPEELPWKEHNIDVVIESTGRFVKNRESAGHLKAGAKRVIISAPSKGDEKADTFLIGVNQGKYNGQDIVSNASCTTNCVGPVTAVVQSKFGIVKAGLTTIHSYTSTQNLVDVYSRSTEKDLRRARAAGVNLVPTSTGAAISTTEAIPELKGKFDGLAIRVPTIVGSLSDFTFLTEKKTTVDEVQEIFTEASNNPLFKNILEVSNEPLVSTDIKGSRASAIVDLETIKVIDGDLIKILAWYDNEMGYSHRLVEMSLEVLA